MSDLPKVERVSDDELELLHAYRNCDATGREMLVDMVRIFAFKQLEKRPLNVVALFAGRDDA